MTRIIGVSGFRKQFSFSTPSLISAPGSHHTNCCTVKNRIYWESCSDHLVLNIRNMMIIRLTMWRMVVMMSVVAGLDIVVNHIKEAPDIYYKHKGQMHLYKYQRKIIHQNYLGYLVSVPIVEHYRFRRYRMWPLPMLVSNTKDKFMFIHPNKEYLVMDESLLYYSIMTEMEYKDCKAVEPSWRVCKQEAGIFSACSRGDCEAKLLEPVMRLPADCS
ncbi:hypothetical protein PR048_005672 [Dryococelus australis]|uniref:Uncharacterized protein n=1 Tax=Dryococelus australis TaxID=614101 RepID=A0ABQ9I8W3_9NEOP|nr:hypothetical protein PR048_005672 [Dryococelus australis]